MESDTMFLCQVSGKLSDFIPSSGEGQSFVSAWVTITERRWENGHEMFVKHLVVVPKYQENWAQKCVEKNFSVVLLATDPETIVNTDYTDAGYSLKLVWQSCFIP